MSYYIYNATINKQTCIGNALSTITFNFSALDTKLASLSSKFHTLSARVDVAYSDIDVLSGDVAVLYGQTAFLSSNITTLYAQVAYVSANVVADYTRQQTLFQLPNGQVNWNTDLGLNAKVVLSANGNLNNATGLVAGDTGNLVIQSNGVSGYSLTGFGTNWVFSGNLSAQSAGISSYNLASFYYDGIKNLSNMVNF